MAPCLRVYLCVCADRQAALDEEQQKRAAKEKKVKTLMIKKKRDPNHGGMSVSLLKFLRTDYLRQEELREMRREELGQSQGENPLQDATLLLQDPVLVDSMLPPIEAAVGTGVGESIDPSLKGVEDQIDGGPKSGMTGPAAELAQKAKAKSDAIDNQAKMNIPAAMSKAPAGTPKNMLQTNNLDELPW